MTIDRSQEIADIDAILNSGATSIEIDGQKVAVDHDALRKRRAELVSEDSVQKKRKRLIVPLNPGRFAP